MEDFNLQKYLKNNKLLLESKNQIDPKYTHFAIRKSNNKIVNGWETISDIDSLKYYAKIDLQDIFPDNKPSEFKLLNKQSLIRQGIDPFDINNWEKTNERPDINPSGEKDNDHEDHLEESPIPIKIDTPKPNSGTDNEYGEEENEPQSIRETIKNIVRKTLDEMSTCGGGAAGATFTPGVGEQYMSKYAFKKKNKNVKHTSK